MKSMLLSSLMKYSINFSKRFFSLLTCGVIKHIEFVQQGGINAKRLLNVMREETVRACVWGSVCHQDESSNGKF